MESIRDSIKEAVRRLRWRLSAARGQATYYRPDVRLRHNLVGGEIGHGGWRVNPTGLDAESIVYSVGVGDDISFDLGMIGRFGVVVHAFDPTPASHAWLQRQRVPAGFVLHKYGLADFDGTAVFAPNDNPDWVSHSMVRTEGRSTEELPVRRLSTMMSELGHDRIDVLKLDIEGAEYSVIDDLLESGVEVRQLLVEFHHRFPEVGWARTDDAIARLRAAGYRMFHVNGRGEEYGFVGGSLAALAGSW